MTFAKRSIRVGELAELASEDLLTRAERERKHLLFEGAEDALVRCDPEWTTEALGNLIKNGLDHTKEGGTVRVSWASSPAMIRICVEDDEAGSRRRRSTISSNGSTGAAAPWTHRNRAGAPLAKSIVEGQGGRSLGTEPSGKRDRIYHGFSVHETDSGQAE